MKDAYQDGDAATNEREPSRARGEGERWEEETFRNNIINIFDE